MQKIIVLAIAIVAVAAPAVPACTPKQGPQGSPTVCITRTTSGFVADPDEIRVGSGRKVKFKFTDGKGKLKIEFEAGTEVRDEKENGPEFTAIGNAVLDPQKPKKYTITDLETGEAADPTIIIEPVDGPLQAPPPVPPGKTRKRLPKE